ncbi:TlpA family protein disulfide reductase [Kribbella deserti]|uniref:TlpA family protein disulfide reductase n=1 Tax=Kribbella deserti TaxID=1926257 RepID=A0ABV6QXG3_9ACTN
MRRTALLVVALLLALTACDSGADANRDRQGQTGFVSGSGVVSVLSPRKPVPELTGQTLDGKKLTLSDYRGKVVVLNVWGSWCKPCRREAPLLNEASKKLGDSVAFVGINTRDKNPVPARKFVQAYGITFPSVYDSDGKLLLRFRGLISPNSIPTTLVIDAEGKVAVRVLGEISVASLMDMVEKARTSG